jgi:hypothetical protein
MSDTLNFYEKTIKQLGIELVTAQAKIEELGNMLHMEQLENNSMKQNLEGTKAELKAAIGYATGYLLRAGTAEAELAAISQFINDYINFKPICMDKAHDDRWCSHCESMEDGIEQFAQDALKSKETIKKIIHNCSICNSEIKEESFVGTGDGTMKNGGSFAHLGCYMFKEPK